MSIWDTIRQVKATKGGNYIQPGTYIVRIQGVRFGKRRQGDEMVAIEMRCLKVLAKVSDADGNSVSNLENEEFAQACADAGITETQIDTAVALLTAKRQRFWKHTAVIDRDNPFSSNLRTNLTPVPTPAQWNAIFLAAAALDPLIV